MTFADLSPWANHLWQSTLFAAVAGLLTLALRKNRASVRYWIWLAASVKFLIPFSLLVTAGAQLGWRTAPVIAHSQFSFAMDEISQPFAIPAPTPLPTAAAPALNPLPAILFGVWLCGIVIGVVLWMRWWRQIRSIRRTATLLDLNLPIQMMSSPARLGPGVVGILRPVLLLPDGITDRLTPAQLETVLAHEMCHVRRQDNLTATIHMLVETIVWFHPLVWWIRTRLMEERERACDEEVLRMGSEPQVYAESILKVCEFYLASPVPCAAGVTGGELKRRIEEIMGNRYTRELSYGRRILLAAVAVAAVGAPIAIGLLYTPAGRARAQMVNAAPAASASLLTGQETPAAEASKASSSAQPAKRDYRFEVASVRRGDPSGRMTGPPGPSSPRRFTAESETIASLAMKAFGVKQSFQIEFQPWMASAYFNVFANFPEGAANTDLPIMIQHLLEDRFGLVFHRETRRVAGYELVVAKSGPKLTESAAPPSGGPARKGGDIEMKNGVPQFTKDAGSGQLFVGMTAIWRGRNKTMKSLAQDLANQLRVPVMDATGMEREYDYTLTFTPEATAVSGNMVLISPPGAAPAQEPRQDESLTNPLLRDALQTQLGLRLQPVKNVPVEVVVLDSAKKEPTEN